MNISSKTWKAIAKHYRDFYNLTYAKAREWQSKCFKLQASNKQLSDALIDMLRLIEEHGSPVIRAHTTRIGKAITAIRISEDINDKRDYHT